MFSFLLFVFGIAVGVGIRAGVRVAKASPALIHLIQRQNPDGQRH